MQKPPPEDADQNRFAASARMLVEIEERLRKREMELAEREADLEKKRHATAQREQSIALELNRGATRNESTSQRLNEMQLVAADAKRAAAIVHTFNDRVGVLEAERMEEIGVRKAANRIAAIFGGALILVVSLGVWLVTETFANASDSRQSAHAVEVLETRQDRTDAAVQSIQTSAATMTAEVRADRQRQDDRWESIKASLSRLENPRRR